MKLTETQAQLLLLKLCEKLGFCLGPQATARIAHNPPATVERFAEVVYRAEGLDPTLRSDLYKQLYARVAVALQQAAQAANS